jgi:hypothetical protein
VKRIAIPLHKTVTADQTLVVACPMYRHLSVAWWYNWELMEKRPCAGLVSIEGVHLPLGMRRLVETAYEKFVGWDRLVVLEDDVAPPPDAFERIALYDDAYDIVGSFHVKHDRPHQLMAWRYRPGNGSRYQHVTDDEVRTMAATPDLHEVDGVAMGFTSIHRRVLDNWDHDRAPMWQPLPPMEGQDLHFCHEAKKQGFRVWMDSGLWCDHLTEVPIGYG